MLRSVAYLHAMENVAEFVNNLSEMEMTVLDREIAAFLMILLQPAGKCLIQLANVRARMLRRAKINTDELEWTAYKIYCH